jgi:FcoT-like thioesterase domain
MVIESVHGLVEHQEHETDGGLMTRVLRVYKPHCRYLKAATIRSAGGNVIAGCEFEIPESCYIDDTGHFNAVEFNICYNQMAYYLLAKSIKERLIGALAGWRLDDFWERQLPDVYIATFESTFRAPMRGPRYYGELEVLEVKERASGSGRQPLIWLRTACRYWDGGDGRCDGRVRLAMLNPPAGGTP